MIKLLIPAGAPLWLADFTRSVEREIRDNTETGFSVTATGAGSSQDVTLPKDNLLPSDVMVFEDGALRWGDYTISGRTLTLTAASSAALVILER